MRAGKMDRRIKIQRKSTEQDESGYEQETWITFLEVWAEKIPVVLKGQEKFIDEQHHAELDVRFKTRFIEGITPKDRIMESGQIYDIKTVAEIGRRRGLDIATQVKADDDENQN